MRGLTCACGKVDKAYTAWSCKSSRRPSWRKRPAAKRQEGKIGYHLAGVACGKGKHLLPGLDQHAVAPWVVHQPMDGSAVQALAVA